METRWLRTRLADDARSAWRRKSVYAEAVHEQAGGGRLGALTHGFGALLLVAWSASSAVAQQQERIEGRLGSAQVSSTITRSWWEEAPKGTSWPLGAHCIEFTAPRGSKTLVAGWLDVERAYPSTRPGVQYDHDLQSWGGWNFASQPIRFTRILSLLGGARTPELVEELFAASHDYEVRMADGIPQTTTNCGRARETAPVGFRFVIRAAMFDDFTALGDVVEIEDWKTQFCEYRKVLEYWLGIVTTGVTMGDEGLRLIKEDRGHESLPWNSLTPNLLTAVNGLDDQPGFRSTPYQFLVNLERLFREELHTVDQKPLSSSRCQPSVSR
jgi:hypothetical protein